MTAQRMHEQQGRKELHLSRPVPSGCTGCTGSAGYGRLQPQVALTTPKANIWAQSPEGQAIS